MPADRFTDENIIRSWKRNAAPWIAAVRGGRIESRRAATDAAVVEAVLSRSPKTVLDIGCGEGWLVRELASRGICAAGVDAVPDLIEEARRLGGGDFRVLSYKEIAEGKLDVAVDAAVCNFSLLGGASAKAVLRGAGTLLNPGGALIVQTQHPVAACGDFPYCDGWREESWAGFEGDFAEPSPWYFRTLESWFGLFDGCGFRLVEMREPVHPKTRKPVSAIFIAKPAG